MQNRQVAHSTKAAWLHVDLYTGPQAKTADLEICRRPDGSLWLLGEGACGKVYKVRALVMLPWTNTADGKMKDVKKWEIYLRIGFKKTMFLK